MIASAVQIIANSCNEIVLVKNSSVLLFIFTHDWATAVTTANTSILLVHDQGSRNTGLS